MEDAKREMKQLDRCIIRQEQHAPISFEHFLKLLSQRPTSVLRNIFQVFHDMVQDYVKKGMGEYPDDPESIGFNDYDCTRLLVEGADSPFFADRLFANRFIRLVEALKRGTQQNKIYIFDGPPGCGKSTFLNNLLTKFEQYANSDEGLRFETVWRLDRHVLGGSMEAESYPLFERLSQLLDVSGVGEDGCFDKEDSPHSIGNEEWFLGGKNRSRYLERYMEIPCPCHDHPILMIPKESRPAFLGDLFKDHEFGLSLSCEKEYDWVFKDNPCTICSSLFEALLGRLKGPLEVFEMLYVRPYKINRRLGEGISVYSPGDEPNRRSTLSNPMLQRKMNALFGDSNLVKYIFSQYAKTNNGIYALMDIKSHNSQRLIKLHNIISEGVHKVEGIEENVYSLFVAVMNPEDKKEVKDIKSFSDRIEYINIPYVMDLRTEVEIYRNIFGQHIDRDFLPRVLNNFARVIISSRLNAKSEALLEWIGDPAKYAAYCDENLQLLKMELYAGHIPLWISEDDRESFNEKRRRKVLAESETEGLKGFSGRDAIKIFNGFYSMYAKEDKLINMDMLKKYFTTVRKDLRESVPEGFLESLLHMYDYAVLQEVKESLYYYNEEQICNDIQNYLFALNFEIGTEEICSFTGEKVEITEDYLESIERHLLNGKVDGEKRVSFRKDTQKEYASKTLTQEIMLEGQSLTETALYQLMHDRYVRNLKARVLEPFEENENFRRAIKDYGEEEFKAYDRKIRDDVTYLMRNLCENREYTEQGAREVCIYVIDNDLAKKFGGS